jgi:hypothetical protein
MSSRYQPVETLLIPFDDTGFKNKRENWGSGILCNPLPAPFLLFLFIELFSFLDYNN